MSAGFRTSYGDVTKRNISHIYSGTPPGDIRLRVTSYHHGLDPLDRQREKRSVTPGRLPWRYYDYIPEYDTYIQKASGFQDMPRRKIKKCVNRLTNRKSVRQIQTERKEFLKQEATLKGQTSVTGHQGMSGSNSYWGNAGNQSIKSRDSQVNRKLRSQQDVNKIVARLYQGKRHNTTV